jgi:hypothetical protein
MSSTAPAPAGAKKEGFWEGQDSYRISIPSELLTIPSWQDFQRPTPSAPILGENPIFPHGKMRQSRPECDSEAITNLPKKEELNGQKISVL